MTTQLKNCGHRTGYMKHHRLREVACTPCKLAWRTYMREQAAARKAKQDQLFRDMINQRMQEYGNLGVVNERGEINWDMVPPAT